MIAARIEGVIRDPGPLLMAEVRKILFAESVSLATYIKREHLTGGTTPTRLAVRSGNLRNQCRALPVTESPGKIEAGVGFGTQYAATHVGPKGQVTTIRAKTKKFLAIPLSAARTGGGKGEARGGPLSGRWGETFIRRTEEGKLIIFGKSVATKGARAGQTRGDVIPLFLLVKQVKVPTRVHPETIFAWERPRMITAFRKFGLSLRG